MISNSRPELTVTHKEKLSSWSDNKLIRGVLLSSFSLQVEMTTPALNTVDEFNTCSDN